ncbi:hypothetical protein BB559_000730 [Furculomyces boomerangus]|uniref:Uncharacterized protein n=2 Tax=Harpellales TaxID=61421 RepID=A0A2T9Z4D5_9FUNG|nr:hypothetical protein BB559_000730 [Furculomyces boomerangus]PWA01154.1 hypothetical protein BB558_002758 [Smittium angustum]
MAKEKFLSLPNNKRKNPSNRNSYPKKRNVGSKSRNYDSNKQNTEKDDDLDQIGANAAYDDSENNSNSEIESDSSDNDHDFETEAEKRLRIAKEYVQTLKQDAEMTVGFDAEEIDKDIISARLQLDVEESSGRIHKRIANKFANNFENLSVSEYKNGHHLSITCIAISSNIKFLYSGSKDGTVVKWDLHSKKKLAIIKGQKKGGKNPSLGHYDAVLCIALSHDGKYLATGSSDRLINIWNPEDLSYISTYKQHKDAVTGLAFRKILGQNQLYSCSFDRMVKLWNVDENGYIETLFGHQDGISDISTLSREQAVTVGKRDKTLRLWKIIDENQLLFRAGTNSVINKILGKKKDLLILPESQLNLPTDEIENSEDTIENSEDKERILETDNADSQEELDNEIIKKLVEEYHSDLFLAKRKNMDFMEGSVDSVLMVDEETFITGGDSGAISLWSTSRKKPIFIHHLAHGIEKIYPESTTKKETDTSDANANLSPRWIISLAGIPLSDMFVSGSWDGYLRIWKIDQNRNKGFRLINAIPIDGYINQVVVVENGPPSSKTNSVKVKVNPVTIGVAVGQEHKFGRWGRMKSVRNHVKTIQLEPSS